MFLIVHFMRVNVEMIFHNIECICHIGDGRRIMLVYHVIKIEYIDVGFIIGC